MNFQYPDILRKPAGEILLEFQKGGATLIWTWWFFGISGLPLLFSYLSLYQVTQAKSPLISLTATTLGIVALFFQLMGLLRWVFVIPVFSHLYTDPNTSSVMKEAILVNFQTIHHLFGVLLGEHLGQLFTIFWMAIISFIIRKDHIFPKWIAFFGFVSSFIYLLAQLELFAIVIPELSEVPLAGLMGSLCWLVWMVFLGFQMVKK
ncbi:PF14329 domain protein [Leptospira wolbachii serovar Codice str. CDC]|uniref:PF14329 domain protein n=2 Tax=Leptospira TaxID=171 RepID=R9A651_9LEPT|nr:PF14329 domain protein [Leptospira wolbachii serovar Codice str. CDC]